MFYRLLSSDQATLYISNNKDVTQLLFRQINYSLSLFSDKPTNISVSTNVGVSIASTGNGVGHNNIQPVLAAYYIMYIPS
jgi:microcystin-dependent protein